MLHPAMRLMCCVLPLLATPCLTCQAQEPAQRQPKKRSLADGLVRQSIERDQLRPPTMRSGLELATGQGPMVLLVRDANGKLTATALPRGRGKHGPAAEIPRLEIGEEMVVEEEIEVPHQPPSKPKPSKPKPSKPKPGEPKPSEKAPGNKAPAPGKPAPKQPAPKPKAKGPARVTLTMTADGPTIGLDGSVKLPARPLDRQALRRKLEARLARHPEPKSQRHLLLELSTDIQMRDMLAVWEVAMSAGYETLLFSPTGRMRPPTGAERGLIEGLAERFEWPARKGVVDQMYDGELLILLNGPTAFRDVLPLLLLCAKQAIWQISFAGQSPDRKKRFKLPVHLPADRG